MSQSKYTTTIQKVEPMVLATLNAGCVPMLLSSPGMGKTSLMRKIAEDKKLYFIDVRVAAIDPVYLEGLMVPKDGKILHMPMDIFPLETDSIPAGYNGWLINFDEITSANKSVQAACYKVLLDHMVGDKRLHPKVYKASCGNLATDNAVVYPLSTALKSRVVTYNIVTDAEAWLDFAIQQNYHPTLLAFLMKNQSFVNNFDPSEADKDTFACERTNEMLSKQLYKLEAKQIPIAQAMPLIAGTVGTSYANHFYNFTEYAYEAVTVEDLRKNPAIAVPADVGARYITISNLACVTQEDFDLVFSYVDKFDNEFKLVYARLLMKKNPTATSHPTINGWVIENAQFTY